MGVTQEQFAREVEENKKHPRVYKPSEGFFIASRQVQDSLAGRLDVLNEKLDKLRVEGNSTGISLVLIEIDVVTKIRDTLRNTLLWDTRRGE